MTGQAPTSKTQASSEAPELAARFEGLDWDEKPLSGSKTFSEKLKAVVESGKVDAEDADYFARAAVDYQSLVKRVEDLTAEIAAVAKKDADSRLSAYTVQAGIMQYPADDMVLMRVRLQPKTAQMVLGPGYDVSNWPNEYKRQWVVHTAQRLSRDLAVAMAKELWK